MTLNQLAERIAFALGDPYNPVLLNNIKFSIEGWRAMFLRRDIVANGLSDEYLQRFSVELEKVDKADTCDFTLDCTILRTKKKVPKPVRVKSDVLFKLVATPDGQPLDYTEYEEVAYRCTNKYTGSSKIYNYTNGYIYVFNNTKLKFLTIQAVFANPYSVNLCATQPTCVTDDLEYPFPEDFYPDLIKGVLTGEFKILDASASSEVKIEEENPQ